MSEITQKRHRLPVVTGRPENEQESVSTEKAQSRYLPFFPIVRKAVSYQPPPGVPIHTMVDLRIIKRYNAYYHGWCLAFGEHTVNYEEERDINWLFGDGKIGLILSPDLRKQAQREFLGHHEEIPELVISNDMVWMNEFIYRLKNDTDRVNIRHMKDFLHNSQSMHMLLCNHIFYPRTRIITFDKEKPITIMYKEMQPLKLILM